MDFWERLSSQPVRAIFDRMMRSPQRFPRVAQRIPYADNDKKYVAVLVRLARREARQGMIGKFSFLFRLAAQ
jgi:hypothetical protein